MPFDLDVHYTSPTVALKGSIVTGSLDSVPVSVQCIARSVWMP